jgi:rare lipoprotein A (peptidoglycan hydrolase)
MCRWGSLLAISLFLSGCTGSEEQTDANTEPAPSNAPIYQQGEASYYAGQFHGRPTANGERFDMNALTCAHKKLPFGTMLLVTNQTNGEQVIVRVNDRGPYAHGRIIDLSLGAAKRIDLIQMGSAPVTLRVVGYDGKIARRYKPLTIGEDNTPSARTPASQTGGET